MKLPRVTFVLEVDRVIAAEAGIAERPGVAVKQRVLKSTQQAGSGDLSVKRLKRRTDEAVGYDLRPRSGPGNCH